MANNIWSDVSSIAQRVESDAIHIVREVNFLEPLYTVFRDMSGMNLRRGYAYDSLTANTMGDDDDLTSQAFTPSADQTLTPYQIGAQVFITDARAESDLPEQIITDSARELGFAAADKIMTDMVAEFPNLTGGTVGTTGGTISFSLVGAAITQARVANKSAAIPLACVIHANQWDILAKSANIAGATYGVAPKLQEQLTIGGQTSYCITYMGVPIYQCFQASQTATSTDFTGAVFPREALAIDWRRQVRIRPERDESRAGLELNMTGIYDVGVWRPLRGVNLLFHANLPTT